MGIDYNAAIMVGLPRDELDDEQVDTWLDNEDLESCPPWYDGEEAAIVGFSYADSGRYQAREFVWDQSEIDELKEEFKELTGQEAKVWISTRGW